MSEQKICPTCGTEYPLSERFCPRDGTALRSASASADLLGSVVADRYHVMKKLGEGGMGTVYLAEHVKMGRKSALKVMNPGMNSDPDAIARFNREAANASRLSHPNICGIYDFGETPDGLIYLAMEFIEGKPLTDLIEEGNGLAPARAARIVHQTADALQVAHDAGIVHRDLKPDNIMVARNRDGSDLVKVVDFGIAKASSSDAQKVTKTGLVVGTPEYMSPEQLAGDKLDGRSDIYSLALVAFNALTGTLPFPSETAQEAMIMRLTDRPRTLAEMRPDVSWPDTVQAVLDRGLARDAGERFQSAATFGRDFAAALESMPTVAATEGATMVIGAQSAAAAGAPRAATRPMPATRVSSKSPERASQAAPVQAPQKKSPLVPIIGGIAAVAVLGYVGFTQFAKTPDPATDPAAAAAAAAAAAENTPNSLADPAGNTGNAAAPAGDPNATAMSAPLNQGRTPGTNPGPRPPSGNSGNPPANAGTNPPAVVNVMPRLEAWGSELQDENATRTTARRILAEVQALQPTLTGIQLGESWFVAMLANVVLEDAEGTCAAARKVKDVHTDSGRRSAADLALQGCS